MDVTGDPSKFEHTSTTNNETWHICVNIRLGYVIFMYKSHLWKALPLARLREMFQLLPIHTWKQTKNKILQVINVNVRCLTKTKEHIYYNFMVWLSSRNPSCLTIKLPITISHSHTKLPQEVHKRSGWESYDTNKGE